MIFNLTMTILGENRKLKKFSEFTLRMKIQKFHLYSMRKKIGRTFSQNLFVEFGLFEGVAKSRKTLSIDRPGKGIERGLRTRY